MLSLINSNIYLRLLSIILFFLSVLYTEIGIKNAFVWGSMYMLEISSEDNGEKEDKKPFLELMNAKDNNFISGLSTHFIKSLSTVTFSHDDIRMSQIIVEIPLPPPDNSFF